MKKLPRIRRRASVISGTIAAPYHQRSIVLTRATVPGDPGKKEIACLITIDDLKALDLSILEPTVIIPGRAFVHDAEAREVLSRDGTPRDVIRERNSSRPMPRPAWA